MKLPKCICEHPEHRHSRGYKKRECWAVEDHCRCENYEPKKAKASADAGTDDLAVATHSHGAGA